jgi:hypothetical protein
LGVAASLVAAGILAAEAIPVRVEFEPFSANGRILYKVPETMPDPVVVKCQYMLAGGAWDTARVNKYRSETAVTMIAEAESPLLATEQSDGQVLENLAAGRERTLIWSTALQVPAGVITKGQVKIELFAEKDSTTTLASGVADFAADFTRVVLLNTFATNPAIYPPIVAKDKRDNPGWFQTTNGLEAFEQEDVIEPLAWRPGLSGYYAIYLQVPQMGYGEIELRLTNDDYSQRFSALDGYEYFWKIAKLDDTHLVIQQPYRTLFTVGDALIARLRYVKLVRVEPADYARYAQDRTEKHDRLVAGYFEPYSWAFREYVANNTKFFEALAAYKEAGVDLVDAQAGRGGARPMFPTNIEEPLLGQTVGDGAPGSRSAPTSLGTGRMVRLADITHAVTLAGKAFSIATGVNFGAANNYHGGPLEGEFSRQHPECFLDTYYLNYGVPQARDALMNLYRSVLQKGAEMVSVDFCRYPHCVRVPEDAHIFLRELRALADEFSTPARRVKTLVRFPVPGTKGTAVGNSRFRPEVWVQERLVDYLVPSDFGGMPYYDVTPYVALVRGTETKCLPCLDGGTGGPPFPGEVLRQANEFYEQGADGIYIYQSDAHIVGSMTSALQVHHAVLRTLGNTRLVQAWLAREEAEREKYSTDVYLHFPAPYQSYRALFWVEGMRPSQVDMYVNDQLANTATAVPYMLGKQGYENHYPFLGKNVKIGVVLHSGPQEWRKDFVIPEVFRSYSF